MDKQTHEQLEAELTTLYQHDPSTAFIEQLEQRLTLQAAAMTTQPARIKWRHKLSHIFSPTSGRLAFALGAFALLLIPLLIIYATRPLPINNSNQLVDRTQPTTTTGDSIAIIQPSQYNALAYVDDLGFIISDNAAYLTKKVTRTVALRDTGFAGWPDQGTLVVRSAATNEQASEFNVELHLDFTEPISRSDYIDDYFDMLNTDYAAHFDIQSRSHIRLPNGITYTVESNKNNQPCNYNNIYIDTLTTWCTGRILKTLEPLPIGTTNVVLVLSDISYHRPKAEAWEIPLNLTPVSEIDPLKQPEIQLFSTSDWAGDTKIISDSHQGITLELVAVAYGEEFTSVLLNSYTDARYNMTPSAADLFPPRLLFGDHTAALLVEDTYFKREDSKTKTRSYLPKNPELQPLFHDNAERSGTQRMQFNSTAPLLNGLVNQLYFTATATATNDYKLYVSQFSLYPLPPNEGILSIAVDQEQLQQSEGYIPTNQTLHYGDIEIAVHGVWVKDDKVNTYLNTYSLDYTLPDDLPNIGWKGIITTRAYQDSACSLTAEQQATQDDYTCMTFLPGAQIWFYDTWELEWTR